MSRALNVRATEADVVDMCTKLGIPFSVMEPLKSGGTRVVLNNSADMLALRRLAGKALIDGPVERSPNYVSRQSVPYL
ncbi:MAG TPA: hypothetical protein VF503_19070 [Sphingobium sp.]|uniref:hypothetical protein n=1 Tax=Sphingobium sp. TaxID=1912891 RepID=UPI002ED19248